MPAIGENNVVLQLWTVSDAPREIQQALGEVDADSWVAHVPAELADEPLVALLIVNASTAGPLRKILLPNGSVLFSGPLGTPLYDHASTGNAVHQPTQQHLSG